MSQNISNDVLELEDKISLLARRSLYLIRRAEDLENIFYNNKTKLDKYSYPNHPKMKYIVFHHNLYINDVTIMLATILSNDRNETSFKKLFLQKEYLTDSLIKNEVIAIKNEYAKSNSKKIRNKIAAHKEDTTIGAGTIFVVNLYKKEIREELLEFLKRIEKICFENFYDPACNSDFDYYRDSDFEIDNFLSSVYLDP